MTGELQSVVVRDCDGRCFFHLLICYDRSARKMYERSTLLMECAQRIIWERANSLCRIGSPVPLAVLVGRRLFPGALLFIFSTATIARATRKEGRIRGRHDAAVPDKIYRIRLFNCRIRPPDKVRWPRTSLRLRRWGSPFSSIRYGHGLLPSETAAVALHVFVVVGRRLSGVRVWASV